MTPALRVRLRWALRLVTLGLCVQLVVALLWTPLLFVLSTILGVGSVAAGALLFLWAIWRHIEAGQDT